MVRSTKKQPLRRGSAMPVLLAAVAAAGLLLAGCAPHQSDASATPVEAAPTATWVPTPGQGAPDASTWSIANDETQPAPATDQYGRPIDPTWLARLVVQALHAEDVDPSAFDTLVITKHDISRMSDRYDPQVEVVIDMTARQRVIDSLAKLRHDGEAEGILWNEVQFQSVNIVPQKVQFDRFRDKAALEIDLVSRGIGYRMRVKNVQQTATGLVLTDGFEWIGEDKID
ncbi:MAG TPA: hypothetical protein VL860_14085 [Planctomycetota bacterium]|nr:hypothetical protein [Planctomycetota bacterium]